MTIERTTRTYLAVPAHRARLLASAAKSQADAVFLDLEDAVPPNEKHAALASACDALTTLDWGDKTIAVRINAFGSAWIEDEVARLAALTRLDAVLMPKAERVADVMTIRGWIDQVARPATRPPLEIDLLIETALGLVNVEALAQADRAIGALHLGVGDFAASIGARSVQIGESPVRYRHTSRASNRDAAASYVETPLDLFAYPMMRLLVAARAFGLRAIDGPCGAYEDTALTRMLAEKAAALGFDGKQVIHPTQIDITRDAFLPTDEELAHARRVIHAMRAAEAAGQGAVSVDGKMIDYANVRLAERVIKLAGAVEV
jgi:malyl-CoA/(S)-citramalyl-CoA lyase